MTVEREVRISQSGRSGTIAYREGENELLFDWEFGGSVVAILWGTAKREWDIRHPWASGRQLEIYTFVAQEVIRQKGPTLSFKIDLVSGEIDIV